MKNCVYKYTMKTSEIKLTEILISLTVLIVEKISGNALSSVTKYNF